MLGENEKLTDEPKQIESLDTTAPSATESNRKRAFLGLIVGGVFMIGLIIAVIVLVISAGVEYKPTPPKPKPVIVSFNPYIVSSYAEETRDTARVVLLNNRTELEKVTTSSADPDVDNTDIIVKNRTDNWEPTNLIVDFKELDEHLINIKYRDPERERWEVPEYGRDQDPYSFVSERIRAKLHIAVALEGQSFFWKFFGNTIDIFPLLTTEACRFQYFDKYIEFEARIRSDNIFGMGQRVESFVLKNNNYSMWNRDKPYDLGRDSEQGTYGSHPFFLSRIENTDKFIGVFMRNSNAMLFSNWNILNNGTYINYKMLGGIIDLYVFHAADADYILKKYHSVIGRPYLPPVWAMGFQQARRGYKLSEMKDVIDHYQKLRIPIEAIWADVELNDGGKSFTVDHKDFDGLNDFVKKLHSQTEGLDMKFVAIANPGLKVETGYKYYDEAIKQGCLIQSAHKHGQPFEGKTYAGTCVWLDYFMHEALLVWSDGLNDLYSLAEYDGIWISYNEPSQMCQGECSSPTQLDEAEIPDPFHNESEFEYIQYRPTLDHLEDGTLPMSAYHNIDPMHGKQYFTHNLFGLQVAQATHRCLSAHFEDKRFFLASRSTWPGSGHYSSTWLDQNYATWDSMKASIAGILNFNMFGITHVGAPIGGFYGNADEELLVRWFELGAFYPLMLSYSNSNTKPKEAYAFNNTIEIVRRVFSERYNLIRFFYTKIFESYAWGGPAVHPLFFEFPEDEVLYRKEIVDTTFMWGKTLLVIPALIQGQTRVRAYLPNWRWYNLRTYDMVVDYREGGYGDYFVFDQPLGTITVLIKAGSIVPYQVMASAAKIMNTEDLKLIPALIVIAPDHTGKAVGSMVSDADGIFPHPSRGSNYYRHYGFTYMNQIFRINKIAGFDFHEHYEFDYFWELIILDIGGQKHVSFACMMDQNYNKKELFYYNALRSSALTIRDENMMKLSMAHFEVIVWGTPEQHDFCKFEAHLDKREYTENDRVMIGELATNNKEPNQPRFDLKVSLLTDKIVWTEIVMVDRSHIPWKVPDVVDESVRRDIKSTRTLEESGFRVSDLGVPFYIEMGDPSDPRDFVFTSRNYPFIYVKNFMHLKLMVNSRHIFGLGERIHQFELSDGLYSIFNMDQTAEESGIPPGNNMWGSHPFYLIHLHNPNLFAGVFFLNSNPIDIRIRHVGMQTEIDHLFVGGIIDAFFFQSASVDEVLRNYHYVIGKPGPIPYWGFGYHQCRWGYRGTEQIQYVEQRFNQYNIPLDALWIDKDYMDDERDFTLDKKKWVLLPKYVELLHSRNIRFVMLVDPALANDPNYEPYSTGLERGVYLKSALTNKPLIGISWPGYSVFIDFFHPSAAAFWEDCLLKFRNVIQYDGLWMDMNEPSNFCDGECSDGIHYQNYNFPLDFYDDLYYNPTHRPLETSTVSMEALHYGSNIDQPEFNYHQLYGLMQSRATSLVFTQKLRQRPFILSSSTFPSSGRYVGHWLGDNYSAWSWMKLSLSGIFNFQMFGIPFIGADICGFNGNTTIPICSRWMQLGAFYPMMRNHNSMYSHAQEPYVDEKLMSVSKKAMHTRYSLARYIYSNHMHTVMHGGVYFKPVMFEFPSDNNTYSILDNTLMLGYAIRMTPVMEEIVNTIISYFPNWEWYEFSTFKKVLDYNKTAKYGRNLTLVCSLDLENINAHIKGGSILAYQPDANDGHITRIIKMLDYPVTLLIAPHEGTKANGFAFFDEDLTMGFRNNQYREYKMHLNGNDLVFTFEGEKSYVYSKTDDKISSILIIGAKAYENTQCVKAYISQDNTYHHLVHTYDRDKEVLKIVPDTGYNFAFSTIENVTIYNSTC